MFEQKEWTLFRDRPDWADVTPISQDDGPYSVVSIAYSDTYRDVFDYLRAIIKSGEKSERALDLTEHALTLNAGNYSVWQLRREIIRELNKCIKDELEYTDEVMRRHEKNYQVWHHRRVLVEWSQDPSMEDEITRQFLESDPKNYHAWQHRQWYIRTFKLFDGEMELVNELIDSDVRNNSAWNERYFVLNNTTEWTDEIVKTEVDFTLTKISLVKRNESSWNYLRGVMFHAVPDSSVHEKVRLFCEDLYSQGERSPYLLAYLVDLAEDALDRGEGIENLGCSRVVQLCEDLETKEDKIRCQYWKYKKQCIIDKSASVQNLKN